MKESQLQKFNKTVIDSEIEVRKHSVRPINKRVKSLRKKTVEKEVRISPERALLITQFYKSTDSEDLSSPLRRALAFKYLMENVSLPVEDGQLIAGLRGTGIKEVPTYPEVCCHSIDDLDILDSREKNPYSVENETREIYRKEIIPYWKGKTMRKSIFDGMQDRWLDAYEAGIFTEFMEQRVPGHTAGGSMIFRKGLREIKKKIRKKLESNKINNEQIEELRAMEITADVMIRYAERYADKLDKLAMEEKNNRRSKELRKIAEICRRVPGEAPQTFHEALQHYWFIHVGIVSESNPWDSFNPGRLDQHLIPFYKKDIESGRLTREKAKELLELFWLKFNSQPAPPKVGVTAQESNTYNDFSKINIGGLKKDGSNGVNEVSYLLLEVLEEMRTVQPNTAPLISEKTPDSFLKRGLEVMRPGFGEPPFFNQDEMIEILLRQGKSLEDARTGGVSGCVETGAFGKECYILSGYFNLPKVLEITLHNGIDPKTGKKIGIETGEATEFKNFEELFNAFRKQLKYFIDIKMEGNDKIESLYSEKFPVPFLSLWIEDCVENAEDYNCGGARYNTQYIQIVGLGSITDSLSSLKYNIYDNRRYRMDEIIESLDNDFRDNEVMRQFFLNKTPRYGNDDKRADDIAKRVLNTCIEIIEDYPLTPVRKASRRVYGLPTTVHVYFGSVCGATPDGRKAGMPLSEGISPVQGADRKGISAVFRTIGKLDHVRTGGTLLNQRLSPDLIQDEETLEKLAQLMRAYFSMGTHHVQYNVVSSELLRRAKDEPEQFRDLMVRVAGYSDYFVNLPEGLQDEIIARTEQGKS